VVLVTHDTSLERFAHRVVFLRDGRVAGEKAGGAAPVTSGLGKP